jgi:hypothetical protein
MKKDLKLEDGSKITLDKIKDAKKIEEIVSEGLGTIE